MSQSSKIDQINKVLASYFKENKDATLVPAKVLMPYFIKAGLFTKDIKNGKPIRDVLRDLQAEDQLGLIPYLHTEQNGEHIYWYFKPKNAEIKESKYQQPVKVKAKKTIKPVDDSDKKYILDLCDDILAEKSVRQMTFNFLLGDVHKDGKTRTKLPVDAFYPELKLVIEFIEAKKVKENFDNPQGITISGVDRERQREIYAKRRVTELTKKDIDVIEIPYHLFTCDEENRIIRDAENDKAVLMKILK